MVFPLMTENSEKHFGFVAGAFWPSSPIALKPSSFVGGWCPETGGRSLEELARSWTSAS
jgi:hypothetical protein